MELNSNTTTLPPRVTKQVASEAAGNLLSSQSEVITEDLATFLVAHHILITGNDSIASIKEYFKREPEILDIVDDLLIQLEKASLIQVTGDKLEVSQRFVDIGGNIENLKKFVPRLFKLSAERVLSDAADGAHKNNREAVRYFALPNDSETSAEAQALYVEYRAKMLALVEKAEKQIRKSDSIRLVGVFNCSLVPEDFV